MTEAKQLNDADVEAELRNLFQPFTMETMEQMTTRKIKDHFKSKFPDIDYPKKAINASVEKLLSELKSAQREQTEKEAAETQEAEAQAEAKPEEEAITEQRAATPAPVKSRKLVKLSKVKQERNAFDKLMESTDAPVNYGLAKNKAKSKKEEDAGDGKEKKKRGKKRKGFMDLEAGASDDDDDEHDDELTEADRDFVVDDDGLGYVDDPPSSQKGKKGRKGKHKKARSDYDIESEAAQFSDTAFYAQYEMRREHDAEAKWRKIEEHNYRMELIKQEEEAEERARAEREASGDIDPEQTDMIYVGIAGKYCPELKAPFNIQEKMRDVMELLIDTWNLPLSKVILVGGGMGGGDHVAVRLFLQQPNDFRGLHIRLPVRLKPTSDGKAFLAEEDKQFKLHEAFNKSHSLFNPMVREKPRPPAAQINITTFAGTKVASFTPVFPTPPPIKSSSNAMSAMGQQRDVRDMFKSQPKPPSQMDTKSMTTAQELCHAKRFSNCYIYDNVQRCDLFKDCHFAITIGLSEEHKKVMLANFKGKKKAL